MLLNQKLYDLFAGRAREVRIELLCLGLGYTAVTLSDGGIGLSYTHFEDKKSCMLLNKHVDYEGQPAVQLLEKIKSDNPVERSMSLALVNALNYKDALEYPEDKKNKIMFDKFKIGEGTRVAMVGFIGPLVDLLKQKQAAVEVLDASRNMGHKEGFYARLANWADVLILTSTSILNNTTEEVLQNVHQKVKTIMLGPSTPMVAAAFQHLPVHMLAGTVPIDRENVLKAIRHGMGTPVLQKFSRKSYLYRFS
ncbi:Rossmann-like domain-containing protein [Thermodesulfobacteriota bacterium]